MGSLNYKKMLPKSVAQNVYEIETEERRFCKLKVLCTLVI